MVTNDSEVLESLLCGLVFVDCIVFEGIKLGQRANMFLPSHEGHLRLVSVSGLLLPYLNAESKAFCYCGAYRQYSELSAQ